MATNLSKSWTLAQIEGLLRILAKQIENEEITSITLADLIHLALCEVVDALGPVATTDYTTFLQITSASALTTDVYDASSLNIDSIVKMEDTDNGLYKESSLKELENYANIPQHAAKVAFARVGEDIYINKGVLTYPTNVDLYYVKLPTKVTADADTLDIRDKHVGLVIKLAKIGVYEASGKAPPEALANVVSANIDKLRRQSLEEFDLISKGGIKS